MADLDFDKLRRIAEAAQPTEWHWHSVDDDPGSEWSRAVISEEDDLIAEVPVESDRRFIATFDPPTVLALLERAERLATCRESLETLTDQYRWHVGDLRAERDALQAQLDAARDALEHRSQYANSLEESLRSIRADAVREERAMLKVVEERDRAEEWADALAAAICPFEVRGEHSSANNPWANALAWHGTPDGRAVPEGKEGR